MKNNWSEKKKINKNMPNAGDWVIQLQKLSPMHPCIEGAFEEEEK